MTQRLIPAVIGIALLSACGGGGSPVSPSLPTPTALSITGVHTLSAKGETLQLRAVVTFSDGSTQEQASEVVWSSTNQGVVAVTAAGMATAMQDGRATVTASFRGLSDAKIVIVDLPIPG